jgi:DNA polymerase III delta prime subunit
MNRILFSGKNKSDIDRFIENPSHAILLVGKYGYGKRTLAEYIAGQLLGADTLSGLSLNPYFYVIEPENNLISIEKIRELKKFFQLKTTGKNTIRRAVIIENAESMNDESQNAILKILEEPPIDSVIILTVSNEGLLKLTIRSRTQKIKLLKPTSDEVAEFFSGKGVDVDAINKNYIFTNGAIGLISSLLNEDKQSDYDTYLAEAKSILSANLLEKLISVDGLVKDKDTLQYKLYCLKQIAKTALNQSISKNQDKMIHYWLKVLAALQKSEDQLAKGANTKLLMSNLFLQM